MTLEQDLRERALRVRRNALEAEVDGHRLILPARRLVANGLQAWAEVLARGYEGYVGKDEEAPYRQGRTLAWLKVKVPHYREDERGWEPTTRSQFAPPARHKEPDESLPPAPLADAKLFP